MHSRIKYLSPTWLIVSPPLANTDSLYTNRLPSAISPKEGKFWYWASFMLQTWHGSSISPPPAFLLGSFPHISKERYLRVFLPFSSTSLPLFPHIRLTKDICFLAHIHMVGVQSATLVSFIFITQRALSRPESIPSALASSGVNPACLPSSLS